MVLYRPFFPPRKIVHYLNKVETDLVEIEDQPSIHSIGQSQIDWPIPNFDQQLPDPF